MEGANSKKGLRVHWQNNDVSSQIIVVSLFCTHKIVPFASESLSKDFVYKHSRHDKQEVSPTAGCHRVRH